MISNKKNFVITIGNYGAVVVLHQGNNVKNKIFLEELNEESKIDLRNLFSKNQSIPISIILDTIDQSYKRKSYPGIKKNDLTHIIKRDMSSDGDSESFKSFIFLDEKKSSAKKLAPHAKVSKQDCLMISASKSEVITKWLDFLLEMPNHTTGIYMSPIETFNLLAALRSDIRLHSSIKERPTNSLCFLILQSKVGGVKQIIFSDHVIIFTRSVNYDFQNSDFLEKYEQDIYSTFEYLKRLFPDLRISEVDIVNIFGREVLNIIKNIGSSELNISNYTPAEVAAKIGYPQLLPENANYCDLLISKVFSKSKKILKFTTPKIVTLNNYFTATKLSSYFNFALAIGILLTIASLFFFDNRAKKALEQAEAEKLLATQELSKIDSPSVHNSQLTEDGNTISIERIIDFGKIHETLTTVGTNFVELYGKLRFLKDNDVKVNSFTYSVVGFNYKIPEISKRYSLSFKGDLQNKSGDIDDLFKEFDSLTSKTKKIFERNNVQYSDIPRNIDFVQKYYTFPIEFTITDKQ